MHSYTSFALILHLILLSSIICSSRGLPLGIRSISSFAGIGVTSILPVPRVHDNDVNIDSYEYNGEDVQLSFYVGTKRGKVKKITMHPKQTHDNDDDEDVHIQCIEDENSGSKSKTPYPIFSMMSLPINSNQHVLTGSGNRYITVWEQTKQDIQTNVEVSKWSIKATLGPHTGWVKDLASSPPPRPVRQEEKYVFSIGCNCIEIWRAINGERYEHAHKLMIESSVEMGSTLSSDILCLATSSHSYHHSTNHHSYYYLLAGGVDGRINRWTICNNSFSNAEVLYGPGHNDRLNSLLVCNDLEVVVSIGNDGFVKCWMLDCDGDFMDRCVCSINVNDEYVAQDANTIKLTCSCILLEKQDLAIIGIGTACGKVLLAEISNDQVSDDDVLSMKLLDERATVESLSSKGCTIHSIASQNKHILIGHSDGISLWKPPLTRESTSH